MAGCWASIPDVHASNAGKNMSTSVIASFLLLILLASFSIGWMIQPEYMSSLNSSIFGLKIKNQWGKNPQKPEDRDYQKR